MFLCVKKKLFTNVLYKKKCINVIARFFAINFIFFIILQFCFSVFDGEVQLSDNIY